MDVIERIKTASYTTIYVKNDKATIKGASGAIIEAHRLIRERLEHYTWMKNPRWTVLANADGDSYGSIPTFPSPSVPRSEAPSTPSVGASNVGATNSSSAAASTPRLSVPPLSKPSSTPRVGTPSTVLIPGGLSQNHHIPPVPAL